MDTFDLFVIGAGPAGYVAAIRAAQLGLKVAIADKRGHSGGTCLNIGCIPSKALLYVTHQYAQARLQASDYGIQYKGLQFNLSQMMAYKQRIVDDLIKGIDFLLRKNKITFMIGKAQLTGPTDIQVELEGNFITYQAKHILIATGSTPVTLPHVPIDEIHILSSTGALALTKVPKHLVVVGGGYIGLELGSVWSRLGAHVTVIEAGNRIAATMDAELASTLQKNLSNQAMNFKFGHRLAEVGITKGNVTAKVIEMKREAAASEFIDCDHVLLCLGRQPYTQGLNLESLNLMLDDRGFIPVNARWQTSVPSIYAIGDVILGPMLAHRAQEEGIAVAEHLAGQTSHVDYDVIPTIIYTSPEVASVGKTEEELKKSEIPYRIGKFPFSANSRARSCNESEGFVKILSHHTTDLILGVHIIGEQAGSMIAEAAAVMAFGGCAEDIARTCHAHPTYSEALKEAAWATFDQPIHL